MRVFRCGVLAFWWLYWIGPAFAATVDLGNGLADHGIAAPFSEHRGLVATADAQGHPVILCWLRDHRGCYELLLFDVQTEKAEEFPLPFPPGDDPFASILSSGNKFYTHFNSQFVEFDPTERAFTFWQKTAPQKAMSMTEDDHGVIWSATYPASGIVSFNPRTRELHDYGHVYQQDWAQYPRAVAADDAGWVYVGIGFTATQILAFDRQTGRATPLLSEEQRGQGSVNMYRGVDGRVYAQPRPSQPNRWLALYQGRATPLNEKPKVAAKSFIAGDQSLFHRNLPDGREVKRFDLVERVVVVGPPKTWKPQVMHFDYASDGAGIMAAATAPDGTICGGTCFPMRAFRYDSRTDGWANHAAYGQWNTLARQGARMFIGTYSGGGLLEWNPLAPWADTQRNKKGSNPELLTEATPTVYRPHRLLAHPDGRTVVLAGTPGYGLTGGGLLFWDRLNSKRVLLTHEQLIPQQSTMSLVALPGDKLLGGTTVSPGTGGQRKADQAELYLLDLPTKRLEWHDAAIPGVQSYVDLCLGPDGFVWGIADYKRFFVFDTAAKKVLHNEPIEASMGATVGGQGPRIFVLTPDKTVYVLLQHGIARVEPTGWRLILLAKSPEQITAGGDYLDGCIYFVRGTHLCSFKLPD